MIATLLNDQGEHWWFYVTSRWENKSGQNVSWYFGIWRYSSRPVLNKESGKTHSVTDADAVWCLWHRHETGQSALLPYVWVDRLISRLAIYLSKAVIKYMERIYYQSPNPGREQNSLQGTEYSTMMQKLSRPWCQGTWADFSAGLLTVPSGYKVAAEASSLSFSHYHIRKQETWMETKRGSLHKMISLVEQENLSQYLPSGGFLLYLTETMRWADSRPVAGITKKLLQKTSTYCSTYVSPAH